MPRFQENPQLEDLPKIDIRSLKSRLIGQGDEKPWALEIGEATIRLSSTQPQYGGARYWLNCPICLERRTCLYLYCLKWQCRVCTGLLYRSQSYDKKSQAVLQSQRLKAKLNDDGSRPLHMRWATYEHVCECIDYYDELYSEHVNNSLYARMTSASPTGRGIGAILKRTLLRG